MSFVTTQPEALAYAAGKLQTLGFAMAAESAAVASPTTGVVPAAADEVSALQAAIFGAYGSLYQSVNAQATAIHEQIVNTLGASAGSYAATESTNSAATASTVSQGISGLFSPAANAAQAEPPAGAALANILNIGVGNWDSAASNLLAMGGGGILPAANETGEVVGDVGEAEAGINGTVLPEAAGSVGSGGLGGVPMLTGLGRAPSVGGLSVPPSWAAWAVPAASPGAGTSAGWTVPVSQSTPVTTVPAAMPAVATAGKAAGLGAPRYGVKPTVMGRTTAI